MLRDRKRESNSAFDCVLPAHGKAAADTQGGQREGPDFECVLFPG